MEVESVGEDNSAWELEIRLGGRSSDESELF